MQTAFSNGGTFNQPTTKYSPPKEQAVVTAVILDFILV